MPALTFVANANVIKLSGCKPVLADSTSLENPNISLETIKKVFTKKQKQFSWFILLDFHVI